MFVALVLNPESRALLLENFQEHLPVGWEVLAHHMTINLGSSKSGPAHDLIDSEGEMVVTQLGMSDKAVAVEVASKIPSSNALKHITLAVNRAGGGKPKDSNNIRKWEPTTPISLKGVVQVVG